jgi:nitrite reductase/ring-hydroxylating ferredoxin subunit
MMCTPGSVSAGNKSSYTLNAPQNSSDGNYIIIKDANGFYGMSAYCPHQGCQITDFSQKDSQNNPTVTCDCHGAQWDILGQNGQGPGRASGSTLQHYVLCIDASGNITVTTTKAAITDRF